MVVKRAAATALDEADLYLLIADEIKDPPSARPLCARRFRFQGEVDREEGSCQNSSAGISNPQRTGSLPAQTPISRRNCSAGVRYRNSPAGKSSGLALAYRPDEALQDRDHMFPDARS